MTVLCYCGKLDNAKKRDKRLQSNCLNDRSEDAIDSLLCNWLVVITLRIGEF